MLHVRGLVYVLLAIFVMCVKNLTMEWARKSRDFDPLNLVDQALPDQITSIHKRFTSSLVAGLV